MAPLTPTTPADRIERTREGDEFWQIVLDDESWLQAEFDAIVSSLDDSEPPPALNRREHPDVEGSARAPWQSLDLHPRRSTVPAEVKGRQRSPPR